MEPKIKLESVTHYYLTTDELKRMYLYIALAKYCYLRNPDYNEGALFRLLRADFKRYQTDAQLLLDKTPNDHGLHKIVMFFANHNKNLSLIEDDVDITDK